MPRLLPRLGLIALLAAASYAAPMPALAASVSVSGTTATYTAAAGEWNHISVTTSGGNITFKDYHPITAGTGCAPGGTSVEALCSINGIDLIVVNLLDNGAAAQCGEFVTIRCELYGGPDGEQLSGGRGNDLIVGGGGLDRLDGRDGNDSLLGGEGDDRLLGGEGADSITGDAGTDTSDFSYTAAAMTISLDGLTNDGEGGLDNVSTENVIGGGGADTITGNAQANVLQGRAGNDTLSGSDETDTLIPGLGQDTVSGGGGVDRVSYNDRVGGTPVVVSLDGVANDGALLENDLVATDVEGIIGGAGNDTLLGSSGPNTIHGAGGSDTISGLTGADTLFGGGFPTSPDELGVAWENDAADTIDGGFGNDKIYGETGGDTLRGGGGADTLDGDSSYAPGDDVIEGGDGNDLASGGPGNDTLRGEGGHDTLNGDEEYDGGGNDYVDGGAGVDKVNGFAGIDTLVGGPDTDTITAGAGNDYVNSNDGEHDSVSCGDGKDILFWDLFDTFFDDDEGPTLDFGPFKLTNDCEKPRAILAPLVGMLGTPVLRGSDLTVRLRCPRITRACVGTVAAAGARAAKFSLAPGAAGAVTLEVGNRATRVRVKIITRGAGLRARTTVRTIRPRAA